MSQRILRFPLFILVAWAFALPTRAQQPDQQLERTADPSNTRANSADDSTRSRVSRRQPSSLKGIGSDVVVKEGETVRDVVVLGASALIDGTVTGNLVVVMGKAKLGPKAEIKRDLVVVCGTVEADPSARIRHNRVVIGGDEERIKNIGWLRWPHQWVHTGLLYLRPLPHQYSWSWAVAGLALLLYLTLTVLFPRPIQAAVTALEEQPGNSLLTGLLAFSLVGPLLLLLMITVVGLLAVPFGLCAFATAFLLGKVAVYRYTGQQIGAQAGWGALQNPLLAVLVGALLFYGLYMVPVLGFLAWGAAASLGVGAVLLAVFRRSRSVAHEPVSAAPGSVSESAAATAEAGPPPDLLPRVGFWLRLCATVLDLILVGIVMSAVFHRLRWFLLAWVIYHLVLWSWKGTTLGGIVFGLRLVRTDGQPITFAVALVRLLGSFFSAVVLGLGFFWAGWTQDKQSWHDKIAGTVVVKAPKSPPLV
jgi:uncharacterized RDD family membrane protein YckC